MAAAMLLGGCALPPLTERSASTAIPPDPGTGLGRGVEPMLKEHPDTTGVVPLQSGLEAFASRVHLADMAERSLDLQYYIWHADFTGTMMMQAVLRAADRGVRVRLLLDDNTTKGMDPILATLDAHPNVELRLYNPVVPRQARWVGYLTDFWRLNHRMHNKSFTADGWVSIVGGRNIGDEYFSAADGANFVDLDVMVIGQVVPAISREFDQYWNSASAYPAKLLIPPDEAAPLPDINPVLAAEYREALLQDSAVRALRDHTVQRDWVRARVVADDPRKTLGTLPEEATIEDRMVSALGYAERDVSIVSPYFVPATEGTSVLTRLARAGVDTRVLTNSFNATDVAVVHAGYVKYRKQLLQGGVKLYELKAVLDDDDAAPAAPGSADNAPRSATDHGPHTDVRGRGPGGSGAGSSEAAYPVRRWRPGMSRASLHAKTSQVDHERVFVGSFNFDPRSLELNTEMGVVLYSPRLAADMAQAVTRAQRVSYEVRLNEEGDVIWIDPEPDAQGQPRVYTTEPGTNWFQRLMLRIIGWLPVEGLL